MLALFRLSIRKERFVIATRFLVSLGGGHPGVPLQIIHVEATRRSQPFRQLVVRELSKAYAHRGEYYRRSASGPSTHQPTSGKRAERANATVHEPRDTVAANSTGAPTPMPANTVC